MRKLPILLLVLLAASFITVAHPVSAEIFLDQPNSIYNLGDDITLSATVDVISDGYFNMDLLCENGKVTITHDILTSTIIRKTFTLSSIFINDLKGQCFVSASYNGFNSQSQAFTISDRVDAYAELDKKELNPSEAVDLRIDATKANGKPLQGFASISFGEAGVSLTVPVVNGIAEYNFSLPSDIAAGTYSIKIEVYEKDKQGNIINKANLENNIAIKQEARAIEISIADQEAKTGEDYKFKIIVYDQTNQTMSTQVAYSLYDGEDAQIVDRVVNSNEEIAINIPLNESPGYRTIIGKIGDFSSKRYFYIPEVEKISFEVINSTLKITNVGNVPYRKNLEIGIGANKKVIDLKLAVGQSMAYNLQAPDGNYEVAVTDGIETFSSNIALTGNAVRVVDVSQGASVFNRYSLVWLFIIGVFGLFIYGVSKGLGKQRFMAYMPNLSRIFRRDKYGNTSSQAPAVSTIKSSDIVMGRITPTQAEHSLVIKGNKEQCAIVAVKIKNKFKVERSDYYKQVIDSINSEIVSHKGTFYAAEDYIMGILAPIATKTFKNEINAVKIAQSINSILNLHNTKFKDKIEFGIGVNSGDLVVEIDKQSKKMKFTSIGNTVTLAKKIAESASNSALLSQPLFRKVSTTVKAKKSVRGDLDVYEVTSIVDRDDNARFLSDFKARNEY